MKRIMVAIDFSDITEAILNTAAKIAKAAGAKIILLHSGPLSTPSTNYDTDAQLLFSRKATSSQHIKQLLTDYQERISEIGISVTFRQYFGAVTEAILSEENIARPDLLIMGTHRHGLIHHLIFGCVTQNVINQSICPVLVVPGS